MSTLNSYHCLHVVYVFILQTMAKKIIQFQNKKKKLMRHKREIIKKDNTDNIREKTYSLHFRC